jgi:hypothetical protein
LTFTDDGLQVMAKAYIAFARWAKNWGVSPSAREDYKQFLLLIRYPLCYIGNTVKPVLRGHHWDKEKVALHCIKIC